MTFFSFTGNNLEILKMSAKKKYPNFFICTFPSYMLYYSFPIREPAIFPMNSDHIYYTYTFFFLQIAFFAFSSCLY